MLCASDVLFDPICCTALSSCVYFFFFQAEDGIRDLVRSRGLGDVYKRQIAFYGRPDLLCIDEIGYLSYDDRAADLLFEVVNLSLIHI